MYKLKIIVWHPLYYFDTHLSFDNTGYCKSILNARILISFNIGWYEFILNRFVVMKS